MEESVSARCSTRWHSGGPHSLQALFRRSIRSSHPSTTPVWLAKFQRHEVSGMVTGVGQYLRGTERPPTLSTFHGNDAGSLPRDVATQLGIGESYDQVRTGVQVQGGSRLEFTFGDAHTVFDEQDFLRAAAQNVEAAVFLRMGGIPMLGRM